MSVAGIVQLLENLTELHRPLLELGEQKKQVIIDNDVERLNQIAAQENKWIKRILDLEKHREQATEAFLSKHGHPPVRNMTISELAKLVFNINEKQALLAAQMKLMDIMAKLKSVNELNQSLIEQSLAFINYSLDLLMGPEDDTVYRNPAQQTSTSNRQGYFDTRG